MAVVPTPVVSLIDWRELRKVNLMNNASSHGRCGGTLRATMAVALLLLYGMSPSHVLAQACDSVSCDEAGCCDGCGSACCSSPWQHCTGVWGEFLYLHPTGADVAHAQQQNGTGGAGTVPFGLIGVADPDYQPGVAVGLNWALTSTSSIAVSYEFFESGTNGSLPIGAGNAIGSLVQHPGAGVISSAGPLTTTYDVDYQLADVEYRRLLFGNNCAWMNYSVGGRFGHLEQDFLQSGIFSGSQTGIINVLTDIEFDGGGLSFGLEGERIIGCRGFSVYGNFGVSPLVGQFTSRYTMQNASTTTLLAHSVWKDDRFVTILDYELGLAWTSCNRRWRISSGYVASFWYNTITTPVLIDAVQANNYVDIGDTLSFDGITARIELRF